MSLDDRKSAILRAVVQQYISTAQPVGSTTIAGRSDVSVSSATVRNELHALETDGYLVQPHTSAGRIPTEKGYRFFVDALAGTESLSPAGVAQVSEFFAAAHGELEQMLARHDPPAVLPHRHRRSRHGRAGRGRHAAVGAAGRPVPAAALDGRGGHLVAVRSSSGPSTPRRGGPSGPGAGVHGRRPRRVVPRGCREAPARRASSSSYRSPASPTPGPRRRSGRGARPDGRLGPRAEGAEAEGSQVYVDGTSRIADVVRRSRDRRVGARPCWRSSSWW